MPIFVRWKNLTKIITTQSYWGEKASKSRSKQKRRVEEASQGREISTLKIKVALNWEIKTVIIIEKTAIRRIAKKEVIKVEKEENEEIKKLRWWFRRWRRKEEKEER